MLAYVRASCQSWQSAKPERILLTMETDVTEPMHKTPLARKGSGRLTDNDGMVPERIAIIGTGPRGLSVIERLAGKLAERKTLRPLIVYAIDDVEVGCGKIWRTDQPDWFIMNTRARNATMFLNAPDDGAWRAGYGPTFDTWWKQIDVNYPGPTGLAPRVLYGKYLKFVLDVVEQNLPQNMALKRVQDRVIDITETADEYVLKFESGREELHVDRIVVSTGYRLAGKDKTAATSSTRHLTSYDVLETFQAGLTLPTDLSDQVVAIKGLGLSFYDVLLELTIGRGGRFVHEGDTVRYVPSGREPKLIVAGSRSGSPLPMRARADRPKGLAFKPHFFTEAFVTSIRSKGPACFRTSYLPWITAEVNLVYLEKTLGPDLYSQFREKLDATEVTTGTVLKVMSDLARPLGVDQLLDLEAMVTPFKGKSFSSQDAFRRAAVEVIRADIAQSDTGEFTDPIKAGLDVLRFIRPTIRKTIDLGGLTHASHHEFINKIAPVIAFLSTGPAAGRARQLLALVESGNLELLGPGMRVKGENGSGLVVSADTVEGYSVGIDVLIDAYIPTPDVDNDQNPAIRSLADAGILRNFMGAGGVEVTPKPFHPVTKDGEIKDRIHVLGIPTESARWFLHVGVIEPGVWDEYIDDADAIAETAIGKLVPAEPDARSSDSVTNPNKYISAE